jgi:RNA polymerase sigma-70 factor (ECF subfamily)
MDAMMVERGSTQELVVRAKAGDRRAFDELVVAFRERLSSSIAGWSRYQLGSRLDVEEIVQETLVRAFRTINRFEWRDDDSFLRWLCGIAKHALAEAAQTTRRAEQVKTAEPPQGTTDSPGKAIRRQERFDRLQAALGKLSPEHREAIILSRIDGLTSVEVARRMNRSPAAIRQLLVRALRELKKNFGETESLHLPDRRLDLKGGGHVE